MVSVLADIARQRDEAHHPALGTHVLRNLRERAPSDSARPADRIEHFRMLAILELGVGENQRALDALTKASAVVDLLPEGERRAVRAELAFWRGVEAMREGETRNCIAHHSSASCLVPLRESGIHADKEPGRRAIVQFGEAIELAPEGSWIGPSARWLLNIAYMTVGEYPAGVPPALLIPFESEADFPRFPDVAGPAGLAARNLAGSAVADDFDGDGLLDIVTATWEPGSQVRYLRNVGDGTFADETKKAGLEGISGGLHIVQADYDGDGDIDVLVLRGAWLRKEGRWPKSLLQNDGTGRFTDVTFEAGLGDVNYPTQTGAWADYDRDGDLDLYVGNEGSETDPMRGGYPSQLFRNDGRGHFTDVAKEAGVQNFRFAKGVTWGDYDNDGWPDVYVSTFQGPNQLYHNNRDGTFTDVATELGVQDPDESFATWFWDFDQDGALDLFVEGYPINEARSTIPPLWRVVRSRLGDPNPGEVPRLYKGDGRGGFRDVTHEQHLDRVTMTMGSTFGDLDNDGYPDAYLGTGYPGLEGLVPNVLYHNERGQGFRDVAVAAGMAHIQKGHGVVFADLDNDGDVDVYHQIGGFFAADTFVNSLFVNPGTKNHWLTIELRGKNANRFGIGARIRADIEEGGRSRSVHRVVGEVGSFGSRPMREEIGLGSAKSVKRLEIVWPATGKTQVFKDVPVDRFVRITEGVDKIETLRRRSFRFAER